MLPIERFEQLATAARDDQPPRVDVADAVLCEIDAIAPFERRQTYVLYAMGVLSAAAAMVVVAITVNVYEQLTDPLVAVLVQSSRLVQ